MVCGIAIGLMYGVTVTCYNLVVLVAGVLHWALAHLLVLSLLIGWVVLGLTSGNILLAIIAVIVSSVLLSALVAPLLQTSIKRHATLEGFMISLGIAIIAVEVMSHWINRGLPVAFPVLAGESTIRFGMAVISLGDILTLLGCVTLLIGFFYLLYRTNQGRALRAVAQDTEVARIMGIPVGRTMFFSFALAGLMAGIVGILLAISLGSAGAALGDHLAIKSLAILLFAGLGNLRGGLICALILGVAEAMTMGYLPGQWVEVVAFSIIIVTLLFKPEGLFGSQR